MCGIEAIVGCLGGAAVGADRDVHTDVAGSPGQYGADGESDGSPGIKKDENDGAQHNAHDTDGGVLAIQIGGCAFLNCLADFAHGFVALRLGQQPTNRPGAVGNGREGAGQGK